MADNVNIYCRRVYQNNKTIENWKYLAQKIWKFTLFFEQTHIFSSFKQL